MGRSLRTGIVLTALCGVVVAGCGDNGNDNISTGTSPTPTATATPPPQIPPGGDASEVEIAVSAVLPLLTFSVDLTLGVESETQVAVKSDECPGGGNRVDDEGFPQRITLTDCRFSDPELGSFEFDGEIMIGFTAPDATVAFDFTITDLDTGRLDLIGGFAGIRRSSGGIVFNGGPILITTPQGRFSLTALNALTVNRGRNIVSGFGTVEDTDDNFALSSTTLTVRQGTSTADLIATSDDGHAARFVLDLVTGELTLA